MLFLVSKKLSCSCHDQQLLCHDCYAQLCLDSSWLPAFEQKDWLSSQTPHLAERVPGIVFDIPETHRETG